MRKHLPNIVLIVCDSLGAKHMSLYGYERKTTPHLERLVEEEEFTVYSKCFAPAGWTSPSHVSLFTGLYPSEHGTDGYNFSLNEKFYVLAEILKAMGYHTIGISNNSLISAVFGFSRGFTTFYEPINLFLKDDFSDIVYKLIHMQGKMNKLQGLLKNWSRFEMLKLIKYIVSKVHLQLRNPFRNTTPYTRRSIKLATRFIKDIHLRKENFFLFMNLMQTHNEYNPPKRFKNIFTPATKNIVSYKDCIGENYCGDKSTIGKSIEHWKARYDEEILFLDEVLFEFYEELKKEGILGNTIFIITSDHGELFGEMGQFMHMFTTYNSLIHIPLLINFGKGLFGKGETDGRIVQLNDLFATIMDLLDSPFPRPKSSFSLLSSEKRRYAISQDIFFRKKVEVFSKKYPDWNYKKCDFLHSNMCFIVEIDNILYKIIYYSSGNFEFYKLSNNLYERNSKDYLPTKTEIRKLKNMLHNSPVAIDQFIQSLPEDEFKMLSVKPLS